GSRRILNQRHLAEGRLSACHFHWHTNATRESPHSFQTRTICADALTISPAWSHAGRLRRSQPVEDAAALPLSVRFWNHALAKQIATNSDLRGNPTPKLRLRSG
ncbi:MAG: hypothetical protein J2P53_01530, partial [Bradyrhizobiaceae bacterium]|nr:hypothetical protein [Bradyrhizobiaceae bacterium]